MRIWLAVLAFSGSCLLTAARAQEPDYAALDAELKFKLDADGRIMMFPDPAAGGAGVNYTPLVDPAFGRTFAHGGMMGWIAMVYQGNTDVASMADADGILTRLGLADDVSLIQTISEPAVGPSGTLLQLMSIRLAQDRGKKQALGPILRVAERDDVDPFVRRAATEAVASLRGGDVEAPAVAVPPLADVLGDLPAGMNLIIVVQQHRLPHGRAILRWARLTGLEVTRQQIRIAGGVLTASQWAGGVMLAQAMGAVPYEFCRRFGNHRVDRSVVGLKLPANMHEDPLFWGHADGSYSVGRLREGLAAEGLEVTGEGDEVRHETESVEFRIVGRRARVASRGLPPRIGPVSGRRLADVVAADDAPIAVYVNNLAGVPLPPAVEAFGLPRRVALWLPEAGDRRIRLVVTSDGEGFARQLKAQIDGLPRMLDRWLDGVDDEEARRSLEPVVELLEDMEVAREGATVSAEVSLAELDVEKTLMALLRAGM